MKDYLVIFVNLLNSTIETHSIVAINKLHAIKEYLFAIEGLNSVDLAENITEEDFKDFCFNNDCLIEAVEKN